MLLINELTFSFGTRVILQNISFDLAAGEIGTLIGSSGSGKTTLLKLLTGAYSAGSGDIAVVGCRAPEAYHHIAYMTQDDLLLPWRTVMDNLLLIGELGSYKRSSRGLRNEAAAYLHEVGLDGWENAYPDQLSGGMRQRVSLARALMQKRPLLLLDEPFGALDVVLRDQLYNLLMNIRTRFGTTILMVTHDFRDALALSDRIFLLSDGKISHQWSVSSDVRQNPIKAQMLLDEMRAAFKLGTGHAPLAVL